MRARLPSLPLLLGVLIAALALVVAVGGVTVALTADDSANQQLVTTVDALESQLLRQALLVENGRPQDVVLFAEHDARVRPRPRRRRRADAPAGSSERARLLALGRLADRWRAAATLRLVSPRPTGPRPPPSSRNYSKPSAATAQRCAGGSCASGTPPGAALTTRSCSWLIVLPALAALGGGGALAPPLAPAVGAGGRGPPPPLRGPSLSGLAGRVHARAAGRAQRAGGTADAQAPARALAGRRLGHRAQPQQQRQPARGGHGGAIRLAARGGDPGRRAGRLPRGALRPAPGARRRHCPAAHVRAVRGARGFGDLRPVARRRQGDRVGAARDRELRWTTAGGDGSPTA